MGALVSCFSDAEEGRRPQQQRRRQAVNPPPGLSAEVAVAIGLASNDRSGKARSLRKGRGEELLTHEQALAAAILLQQSSGGGTATGTVPFDRSTSLRYPGHGQKKQGLPRSSSSRPRSLADPVLQPQQLVNQVILVGHDFGGACVSYAMEMFPSKVAKAIFLCAAMPTNGQNTLDMFSEEAGMNDLMQQAQVFVYANGKDHPPTAIDLDRSLLKELLFNQSPAKDVALALVAMRSVPFAPVLEKLSLTDKNYGSVRRFYIETTEDNAIPISLQQSLCDVNPPEKVFRLKGSDHSPFFSKPQALHKLLVEISSMPSSPTHGKKGGEFDSLSALNPPFPLSLALRASHRLSDRTEEAGACQVKNGSWSKQRSDEAPKSVGDTAAPAQKPSPPPPVDNSKQIPAGIQGSLANNYHRADGQNTGNFIT
ncbi:alpha/beta hydrolase fold, partial [Musa troglodytarum]